MNETIQTERRAGRPRKRSARGPRYDPITVQLPPDLVTALDAATEAEGLDSRSEVIRQACRSYLKRAEKRLGERLGTAPSGTQERTS